MTQITVKRLEWEVKEHAWPHTCVAASVVGQYTVWGDSHSGSWSNQLGGFSGANRSLDAAKTAAQADFERRILSALEAP